MIEVDVRDNTRNHPREATLLFTNKQFLDYLNDLIEGEIEILRIEVKNEAKR